MPCVYVIKIVSVPLMNKNRNIINYSNMDNNCWFKYKLYDDTNVAIKFKCQLSVVAIINVFPHVIVCKVNVFNFLITSKSWQILSKYIMCKTAFAIKFILDIYALIYTNLFIINKWYKTMNKKKSCNKKWNDK